ncbi:alcohol dehydrogenase catalytic domain-containing protein [Nostocoides sp. F2B08]|uniref:zinc-dependent alcohol dehydrogenase family protein n=1 Tax=Nostocoides sp. F2B08 TaxID=2653936 RepID=UPI00126359D9|nr:zinc-dependent alcohol dehydrogenase family protein [Tetrasphaera sp. F2B08]KAB7745362.1 alcohol dehydrogenase catalytic domain-containing protein [Tetrasphaera sp. F2B08]
MRAVVVDEVRSQPLVRKVADPASPPDGVVVRVVATGICHSDWHAWAGHDDIAFPHVPGHELAGVVAEVGPEVRRWRVGDTVTVPFVCGCGTCEWCLSGNAQVCPHQEQPGFTHWGSFAELVALHAADTNLVAVPDGVDLTAAAALGCRFATAFRALIDRAQVREGEWVTVIGAGGVGLSSVMIARAHGARVIAVDRSERALSAASALGADHTLLAGDATDVPAAVADLTEGGSHITVDAVGAERTCADAILSLRRRGRHVQIGLLPPVDGHPRVPMDRVIGWELDVLGSHGMAAADYPRMLALIETGRLDPQRLVERTVGLADAAALLPRYDRLAGSGMTMVDPTR